MKAALCQLDIVYEGKMVNLINAEKYIKEASEAEADIIFFPEMTLTGFSMNITETGDREKDTLKLMTSLAVKYEIAVGFGWASFTGDKGENHYSVIASDGSILADYIKIHPFSLSGENQLFRAGTELSEFSFHGRKIGIFLCYDLRFPEIYQAASEECDVLVTAANWPESRISHWNILLQARAVENQSWVLGINCYGDQQSEHYCGNTSIYSPDGRMLRCISDREGIIYAEIGDEAENLRTSFPVKKDRNPQLYSKLL